jgi:hypothetical protein
MRISFLENVRSCSTISVDVSESMIMTDKLFRLRSRSYAIQLLIGTDLKSHGLHLCPTVPYRVVRKRTIASEFPSTEAPLAFCHHHPAPRQSLPHASHRPRSLPGPPPPRRPAARWTHPPPLSSRASFPRLDRLPPAPCRSARCHQPALRASPPPARLLITRLAQNGSLGPQSRTFCGPCSNNGSIVESWPSRHARAVHGRCTADPNPPQSQ